MEVFRSFVVIFSRLQDLFRVVVGFPPAPLLPPRRFFLSRLPRFPAALRVVVFFLVLVVDIKDGRRRSHRRRLILQQFQRLRSGPLNLGRRGGRDER